MLRSVILIILLSYAAVLPQTESKITLIPAKPKSTDIVQIIFQPGEKSPLLNADTVLFQGKFYDAGKKESLEEFVMEKKSSGYELKLDLNNKNYTCVVFQFAGKSGDKIDCNNNSAWDFLVYDNSGLPLKSAYYNIAQSYGVHPYPLKREINNKNKIKYLEEEYNRYPKDFDVNLNLIMIKTRMKESIDLYVKEVQSQIDSLLKTDPDNLNNIYNALNYYSAINDKDNYSKMREKLKAIDKTASLSERRNKIFAMTDEKAKLDTVLSLYKAARGTRLESFLTQDILMTDRKIADFDKYAELTKDLKDPDMESLINSLSFYLKDNSEKLLAAKERNDPKQKMIEKLVERNEEKLFETMEFFNKSNDKRIFKNFPSRQKYARKRAIGGGFGFVGIAEYAKGNYEKSINYFETSEKLLDENEFLYKLYITPYIKALIESTIKTGNDNNLKFSFATKLDSGNERIKKAIKYAIKSLDNEFDEELAKTIMQIDAKLSIKSEALSKSIDGIKEKQKAERDKYVKGNYKKELTAASDFEVKDLNGKNIKLSNLKGKIVILDFWATSCGWCLHSFKYIEKFYLSHKDEKDLFVGAINIELEAENNPKAKEKQVKSFLAKNKFNIPFLIDYGNKTGSLYQINGIPTLIIIGPNGKIYFREEGFGGPTLKEDIENIVSWMRKEKL